MRDTKTKNLPFGKPLIDEAEKRAVAEVLSGTALVHGPRIKKFENDFCAFSGAPFSLSLASCTAGLHLSYFYLGIGPGDEVIVPAQTHVATAHAVEYVGAKPVFVDADPATGNIALDQIEDKVTKKTRALSLVHFLGLPVRMDRIIEIKQKYGLFIVEDCALSIGAYFNGKHTGLWGDTGCFSFYPVKHMTTAEGGMLITHDESIAKRIERQRAFGVDRHVGERAKAGTYDVNMLGFNYRMNEIEAAIGIEQLKKMNRFLSSRKNNFDKLYSVLADIDDIRILYDDDPILKSSHYCLTVVLENDREGLRDKIATRLKERGVGTSIYYPQPVPMMTYYKERYGYQPGEFPAAEKISYSSIALSVGPHLNGRDMEYIADAFKASIKEVGYGVN